VIVTVGPNVANCYSQCCSRPIKYQLTNYRRNRIEFTHHRVPYVIVMFQFVVGLITQIRPNAAQSSAIPRGRIPDIVPRDKMPRTKTTPDKMSPDKMPHGKKTPGQNATPEINGRTKCHPTNERPDKMPHEKRLQDKNCHPINEISVS